MGKKDIFWKYCNSKDDNWLTCIFCRKEFSGGITNMKYHWAGMEGNDIPPPCVRVFKSVKEKAVASIRVLQTSSRVNIRAREDDFPLPPSKVRNTCNQRGHGVLVKEPFDSVSAMDNTADGDGASDSVADGASDSDGEDGDDRDDGDEYEDDDIQILDELNIDSKTSLAVDIANTKMHDDLYEQIVSCYGRLEGNLPRNLNYTAGMKKDILQIILEMIRTKPLDLSDSIITKWESIVEAATSINFNVGWLVAILAKMRMNLNTNMTVKLQEEKVESLKRNANSLKEELRKVKDDLEITCLDLQKLKSSEMPVNFEFDCARFISQPQQ